MSIESVMPSNHLVLYHSLLLLSIFPSIRVSSNESALHIRWPMYWSFSFSISLSNEYSELISFRIDWFDLLAVQGTLKGLLQHPSLKVSILWHSAFLMDQLSYPYMTIEKNIALTIWIFVDKVLSILFNTLSRFVTAFLPRLFFFIALLPKLTFTQKPEPEYLRQSQNSVYCLIPFMRHFGKERILGTENGLLVARGCERIRSLMALITSAIKQVNKRIC